MVERLIAILAGSGVVCTVVGLFVASVGDGTARTQAWVSCLLVTGVICFGAVMLLDTE
ncbi:MAG: hypothetical protein PHP45_07245 [Elusimicrobiales bacterium]|nr:hypothetical protein [Elusimicrobiales bacterium]